MSLLPRNMIWCVNDRPGQVHGEVAVLPSMPTESVHKLQRIPVCTTTNSCHSFGIDNYIKRIIKNFVVVSWQVEVTPVNFNLLISYVELFIAETGIQCNIKTLLFHLLKSKKQRINNKIALYSPSLHSWHSNTWAGSCSRCSSAMVSTHSSTTSTKDGIHSLSVCAMASCSPLVSNAHTHIHVVPLERWPTSTWPVINYTFREVTKPGC